jgi:DNA polymerase III delta prime subunit
MRTETSPVLSALIGQPLARRILENVLTTDTIAPAYLLHGPDGVGKLTAARVLATALAGVGRDDHPDILSIEPSYLVAGEPVPASSGIVPPVNSPLQIRVSDVREIGRFVSVSPLNARRRVVIVDSVEHLNRDGANAFLKTLEEPAGGSVIVLTCNDIDRLPPTIVSRCVPVPFYPLAGDDLREILALRGLAGIPDTILEAAGGSVGRAIALLEMLGNVPAGFRELPRPVSGLEKYKLTEEIVSFPLETQLLLADYWEYRYRDKLTTLEELKSRLARRGNPVLCWDLFWSL